MSLRHVDDDAAGLVLGLLVGVVLGAMFMLGWL